MQLELNQAILKQLPQYKTDAATWEERFNEYIKWHGETSMFDIDIEMFTDEEQAMIFSIAENKKMHGLSRKISFYRNIHKDPEGPVKRLDSLAETAKVVISKLPNKWLFSEAYDGMVVPFFVSDISYTPYSSRDEAPAHVTFILNYVRRGEGRSSRIVFYSADVKESKSVVELLTKHGYFLETPELVASYMQEVEKYKKICTLTGSQFTAVGRAEISNDNWDRGQVGMEREGVPSKVVMDDMFDADSNSGNRRTSSKVVTASFWAKKSKDPEEVSDSVIPPVHPYVKVFDLQKHRYVVSHVSNLEPYVYDTTMAEKLVLPRSKKELVDILIQGTFTLMDDIVKGKAGGIIVLATGLPGTGKTLTAEVYSEAIKKPLYVVQCSQLGTDADSLEQKLTEVLQRAVRWGAILPPCTLR